MHHEYFSSVATRKRMDDLSYSLDILLISGNSKDHRSLQQSNLVMRTSLRTSSHHYAACCPYDPNIKGTCFSERSADLRLEVDIAIATAIAMAAV